MSTCVVITAQALARERLAVFPCRLSYDGRKLPCTEHGINDATTDPGEVERLWRLHPGPLIGVRCGAVSNLAVLDVDAKHSAARNWFAQNRPRLPVTRVHRTRSGGLHFVFQYTANFPTTVGRIVRGVDTRGESGYIVWWPSAGLPVLHAGPIAAAPDWLIDALKQRQPQFRPPSGHVVPDDRRIRKILAQLESATEGERNHLTFWAACRFGEMIGPLLSEAEALELVIAGAMRVGLPYREACATTKSGLGRRGHG